MADLMRVRIQAGVEAVGEDAKWIAIAANFDAEKWAEKEGEHRGWIIAELEKRVVKKGFCEFFSLF